MTWVRGTVKEPAGSDFDFANPKFRYASFKRDIKRNVIVNKIRGVVVNVF